MSSKTLCAYVMNTKCIDELGLNIIILLLYLKSDKFIYKYLNYLMALTSGDLDGRAGKMGTGCTRYRALIKESEVMPEIFQKITSPFNET